MVGMKVGGTQCVRVVVAGVEWCGMSAWRKQARKR